MKSKKNTLKLRKKHLGPSLSLAYSEPLKILRGKGQYLYDEKGKEYLDCVNNISHVGHCHPAVIQAAHEQNQLLNTNTRYLHDNIVELAEKLCRKLPKPLSICYFVKRVKKSGAHSDKNKFEEHILKTLDYFCSKVVFYVPVS